MSFKSIGGNLYFLEQWNRNKINVRVIFGNIKGLTDGNHTIHIHEFGDVSGEPKCGNTGGLFNPYEATSGIKVGDSMDDVESNNGDAEVWINLEDQVELNAEEEFSILDRSVVIDDDPNGDGQIVVCCKIKKTGYRKVANIMESILFGE